MPINVDGVAVLRAIAENPLAFPDVTAELNELARKLVVKQLKAKATSLDLVRLIHSAIGGEAFILSLDDLSDPNTVTLVKKLDKENSRHPTTSPECRKRIADLASGAAAPAAKPPKPAPEKKTPKAGKLAPSPEHKALKAALTKVTSLATARDLWRNANDTSFTLALGDLALRPMQTLARKLDKDNPDIAACSVEALRDRIADLASGRAEPVFRNVLESKSLAAVGRRRTK